jgi:hypothetical protein
MMKKWEIECIDKFTGTEKTKIVQAASKSRAIKQVHNQGYLIGGVFEHVEIVNDSNLVDQEANENIPDFLSAPSPNQYQTEDTGLENLRTVGIVLILIGIVFALLAIFWTPFDIDEISDGQWKNFIWLLKAQVFFLTLSGPLFMAGVLTCSMATLGKSLQSTLRMK